MGKMISHMCEHPMRRVIKGWGGRVSATCKWKYLRGVEDTCHDYKFEKLREFKIRENINDD
jgi:hypothetical protein